MTRPLGIGTAAIIVAAILLWLGLQSGREPAAEGVVQITHAPPPRSEPPPVPTDAPAMVRRAPVVATQQDMDKAADQSFRRTREKRDRIWAERSEASIGRLMRGIPYIGGAHRLEIRCAATLCEVSGTADPDPATGSYKPVWERLERDTVGEVLRAEGLERVGAIFDTGRNPDEFNIQYRRIAHLQ